MEMTPEQEKLAVELFGTGNNDPREGEDRLTVRFDPDKLAVYRAKGHRKPVPGLILLHYKETPSVTPTGGHYTARRLTVRTRDGKKWWGTVKHGTDIVKLRLADDNGIEPDA